MARYRGESLQHIMEPEVARMDGGHTANGDETPLWAPLEAQPGRGLHSFGAPALALVSPQRMALDSPADELFFGGSPGGGKTQLVLGAAVTQHRSAIIFREEFSQLRGAEGIWQQSHEMVGMRGTPNEGIFTWRGLPGGRTLEFGATGHLPQHWNKYKGRPHDLKGFDELPEIPEQAYRFLIGWLRTKHEGQRMRVIGTGNPPMTSEGQWVVRYWAPWLDKKHARPAQAGELRWFVVDAAGKDAEVPGPSTGWARPPQVLVGGDLRCRHVLDAQRQCARCGGRFVQPRSRTFVPSFVEDNPYYMRTGYADILDNLPEPMRSIMRFGNFGAVLQDDPWQVIPTAWVDAAMARWTPDGHGGRPMNAAGTDPSRGGQDEFVIAARHDEWVAPLVVHQGPEAPDGKTGANLVYHAIGDGVRVQIDIGGSAGSSVYDHCVGLQMPAVALNGSERTDERTASATGAQKGTLGFFNKRAKWYWRMRELLDPDNGHGMALPPDQQMRADLAATRWEPTPRGIRCEDKELVKKRLGRSPDRGEGVIYACVDERESKAEPPPVIAGVWGTARRRT